MTMAKMRQVKGYCRKSVLAHGRAQQQRNDLGEQHKADLPDLLTTKKWQASDLLTVFTEKCVVKFVGVDGVVDSKKGRWCIICK